MTASPSLRQVSASGAAWNLGGLVLGRLVTLASTAVLARLLVPEDFGLMALGLLVIVYADAINDFGLDEAVVIEGGRRPRAADVAFTLSVTIGLLFAATGVIAAPLLADVLGDERLTDVIRALSLVFLIVSLGQIQKGELSRRLLFRRRIVGEAVLAIVKATVSIALAVAGLGVWALVWGQLAGTAARVLADWLLSPWKPRPFFDRTTARSLLSFGGRMSLAVTLGTLALNLDYLAIGRRLGAAPLGLYYLAYRLPEILIVQTTQAVTSVLFPVYVSATAARDRLIRGLHDSTRAVAAVATPLGIGLCVDAREVIQLLFGAEWSGAVPVLRLVALASVFVAVTYPAGAALKAMDRPGVLAGLAGARLAVAAPLLWYAAGLDIERVAQAQLAIAVSFAVLQLALVGSLLGARAMPFGAIAPVLLAGIAMTLTLTGLRLGRDIDAPGSLLTLTAGTGVYVSVLWLLTASWWRGLFTTLVRSPSVRAGFGDATE